MTTHGKPAEGGEEIVIPRLEELASKAPCPRCREPIEKRAQVCIHCKSDLTWRRFFPSGFASLAAAITTLLAVSAALGPQLKKLYGPQDAVIKTAVVGSGREGGPLLLLVSNEGTRKAIIGTGYVTVPHYIEPGVLVRKPPSLLLRVEPVSGTPIVDPGTTEAVTFTWMAPGEDDRRLFSESFVGSTQSAMLHFDRLSPKTPDRDGPRCELALGYVSSSGEASGSVVPFACNQIAHYLTRLVKP